MAGIVAKSDVLAFRVAGFWLDMRGSTRALLDEAPGEGRLLAFAMLSGFLFWLQSMAELWLDPATAFVPEAELLGRVSAGLVAAMFFRTLALYGVAAISRLLARAAGSAADWKEMRIAVFWSSLVAAPVGLFVTVVSGLANVQSGLAGAAGSLAFAIALSYSIAEAAGFRRPLVVFAFIACLAFGAVAAVQLIGGA